jgi:hypothetical protein
MDNFKYLNENVIERKEIHELIMEKTTYKIDETIENSDTNRNSTIHICSLEHKGAKYKYLLKVVNKDDDYVDCLYYEHKCSMVLRDVTGFSYCIGMKETKKGNIILISEYVKHKYTLGSFIKSMYNANLKSMYNANCNQQYNINIVVILLEILHILTNASILHGFTHYDLHSNNILIADDDYEYKRTYNIKDGRTKSFTGGWRPVIIDFGKSHVDGVDFKHYNKNITEKKFIENKEWSESINIYSDLQSRKYDIYILFSEIIGKHCLEFIKIYIYSKQSVDKYFIDFIKYISHPFKKFTKDEVINEPNNLDLNYLLIGCLKELYDKEKSKLNDKEKSRNIGNGTIINGTSNLDTERVQSSLSKSATILAENLSSVKLPIESPLNLMKSIPNTQYIGRVQKHPTQPETDGAAEIAENLSIKEIQIVDPLRNRPIDELVDSDDKIITDVALRNLPIFTESPYDIKNDIENDKLITNDLSIEDLIKFIKDADIIRIQELTKNKSLTKNNNYDNAIKKANKAHHILVKKRIITDIFGDIVINYNEDQVLYNEKNLPIVELIFPDSKTEVIQVDSGMNPAIPSTLATISPPKLRLRPSPTHLEHSGIGLHDNSGISSVVSEGKLSPVPIHWEKSVQRSAAVAAMPPVQMWPTENKSWTATAAGNPIFNNKNMQITDILHLLAYFNMPLL